MKYHFTLFLSILLVYSCKNEKQNYSSVNLKIRKITQHTFSHTSYLQIKKYGKYPCNGMVLYDNNEAVIFDTPVTNEASTELISWVQNTLKCKIIAVIPTHFHVDCLGGLSEFHKNNIPSFAIQKTLNLLKNSKTDLPEVTFSNSKEFVFGNTSVTAEYFGKGHTLDNIVAYFPKEKVLFGGCLLKSLGAKKGNLNDADTTKWSNTVLNIKNKYPDILFVIPGHGKTGDLKLLDYTINLFKQ